MERRLAAILVADVVGYSRLVRVDEEGTIAALKTLRADLIDPRLKQHNGRIVKLMGEPQKMSDGDRHLSLRVNQHRKNMRAVAFGQGERADELAEAHGEIDIAYRPVINDFRGFEKVEIQLVDWRPSEES